MLKKFITPLSVLASMTVLLASCGKSNGNLDNKNPIIVVPPPADTTKTVAPTYSLVWSDEFDEASIDETKWNFELGSLGVNNEKEYYQKENATIQDGNLVITAKAENVNGFPYTSAR